MRISYQKLWRMMRDNKMKKGDLASAAEISDYAMSKLSREEPFWEKTAQDIGTLVGTKWKNHPLAMDLGIVLYGYIEKKCKAKGGGST